MLHDLGLWEMRTLNRDDDSLLQLSAAIHPEMDKRPMWIRSSDSTSFALVDVLL